MAQINKKNERVKDPSRLGRAEAEQESKKAQKFWLENQTKRIRSFSERHSARFARTIALIILLSFFSLSLSTSFLPKNQFDTAKEAILKNPEDIQAHLVLAEEFLNRNRLDQSLNELVLVDNLYQQIAINNQETRVLGISSVLNDLWNRWRENNKGELEKLVAKWRGIVADNLDYRDGYLRLAIYYFRLGDDKNAKENLNIALKLDPNFEPAKSLQNIIP
jgi:tetratricopeptide (TPR) repeat protein